jgi:hypothetical protein
MSSLPTAKKPTIFFIMNTGNPGNWNNLIKKWL